MLTLRQVFASANSVDHLLRMFAKLTCNARMQASPLTEFPQVLNGAWLCYKWLANRHGGRWRALMRQDARLRQGEPHSEWTGDGERAFSEPGRFTSESQKGAWLDGGLGARACL